MEDRLKGYQEGTEAIIIWLVHNYTGRTHDNLSRLRAEVDRLESTIPEGCTDEFLAGLDIIFRQVRALTTPIGL